MKLQGVKAYYAAALFNEGERAFNLQVKQVLDELGIETWFPQEDAGFIEDYLEQGMTMDQARHRIFEQNLEAVEDSDILIFNLDGRVPDEGACIEAGIAFGRNKRVIGLQTDFRAVEPGGSNNLMIDGIMDYEVAKTIGELKELLENDFSIDLRGEHPRIDLRESGRTYVALTGPLGSGKTTLLGILESAAGWKKVDEPNDENPYLDEVYANPTDLAFRMQVYYLARRAQQHHSVGSESGRIVQERCILDDGEVFFPAYHRAGAYDEADLATLVDMYRGVAPGLELPDRIVAVNAPFEVCMERVKQRARGGEQHLDEKLAREIYDGYQEWWQSLDDVIWLDTGELDLVDSPEDKARAVQILTGALEPNRATVEH